MDQLLASLPTRVIAIGAIIIGLIFILLNDPPRTVCDTQLEIFKEAQLRFLYQTENKGVKRTPDIQKELANCRQSAGPGGCFELFENLKKMLTDLENVPRQCASAAGGVGEIRGALLESLRLIIMLAWGDKAPVAYTQRYGWLDAADVALFCRLKHQVGVLYGREAWNEFRAAVLKELPQVSTLNSEQVWQRSIVSTSCENFR